ncbi:hypothetical protein CYMTET_10037 [Cymbomonas tetramitiformis]|uniref:TRP C-terminal domain-containing protein n=1 Tax=Cymbomonas tetramitiformis TaxID=36881 RepID=A0AAE0GRJ0_9CHLO|nr:hypothetical protein CYMTET_10037 [Cymbomonas tetramitiformis]
MESVPFLIAMLANSMKSHRPELLTYRSGWPWLVPIEAVRKVTHGYRVAVAYLVGVKPPAWAALKDVAGTPAFTTLVDPAISFVVRLSTQFLIVETTKTMQVFAGKSLNGQWYVGAAPDIDWGSKEHMYMIYGSVLFFTLYCLFIPGLKMYVIWRGVAERTLGDKQFQDRYKSLYLKQFPEFWWWFIFNSFGSQWVFVLIKVLVSDYPAVQGTLMVLLLGLQLAVVTVCQPNIKRRNNIVLVALQVVMLLMAILGMLSYTASCDAQDEEHGCLLSNETKGFCVSNEFLFVMFISLVSIFFLIIAWSVTVDRIENTQKAMLDRLKAAINCQLPLFDTENFGFEIMAWMDSLTIENKSELVSHLQELDGSFKLWVFQHTKQNEIAQTAITGKEPDLSLWDEALEHATDGAVDKVAGALVAMQGNHTLAEEEPHSKVTFYRRLVEQYPFTTDWIAGHGSMVDKQKKVLPHDKWKEMSSMLESFIRSRKGLLDFDPSRAVILGSLVKKDLRPYVCAWLATENAPRPSFLFAQKSWQVYWERSRPWAERCLTLEPNEDVANHKIQPAPTIGQGRHPTFKERLKHFYVTSMAAFRSELVSNESAFKQVWTDSGASKVFDSKASQQAMKVAQEGLARVGSLKALGRSNQVAALSAGGPNGKFGQASPANPDLQNGKDQSPRYESRELEAEGASSSIEHSIHEEVPLEHSKQTDYSIKEPEQNHMEQDSICSAGDSLGELLDGLERVAEREALTQQGVEF